MTASSTDALVGLAELEIDALLDEFGDPALRRLPRELLLQYFLNCMTVEATEMLERKVQSLIDEAGNG